MNKFRPRIECLDARINPTSPHFVSAASSFGAGGTLVVTFHEAGLGDSQNIDYALTGDASATYQWMNKGGNRPQGEPFNVNEEFLVEATISSTKNGNVKGTLTASPPGTEEFFATNHAANWVPRLEVSYTNVVLADVTNGVSVGLADQGGTFTA